MNKMTTYDIWAVQDIPNELPKAIANILNANDIILFTNVVNSFNLGSTFIKSKNFDKIIYSEEKDCLILISNNPLYPEEYFEDYLNQNNIAFSKITLNEKISEEPFPSPLPNLWFARDITVLKEAFEDSIANNCNKNCIYYPYLTGNINFKYNTKSNILFPIDSRFISGALEFEDKLVLYINQHEKRNLNSRITYKTTREYGFTIYVHQNEPKCLIKEKKQIKKLISKTKD